MFFKAIIFVAICLILSNILLSKNISDAGNNISGENRELNHKKFPTFHGPFSFQEKGEAALTISKFYCQNKKSLDLKDDFKEELIQKELLKNNLSINLKNSVEVLRAANKVSELLDKDCNFDFKKTSEKELIFKQYFKYNLN